MKKYMGQQKGLAKLFNIDQENLYKMRDIQLFKIHKISEFVV